MPAFTREYSAEVLGIEADADTSVATKAYRKLAMQWHPD